MVGKAMTKRVIMSTNLKIVDSRDLGSMESAQILLLKLTDT